MATFPAPITSSGVSGRAVPLDVTLTTAVVTRPVLDVFVTVASNMTKLVAQVTATSYRVTITGDMTNLIALITTDLTRVAVAS